MKRKIVSIVAVSLIFFASCSKNNVNSEGPEKEKTSDVKVENGVLAFKSYASFFSALAAQTKLTKQERAKWERELGFTSMRTQYEQFNAAVNELDRSIKSPEQYDNNDFLKIVERYKPALAPTRDAGVYNLNASGMMEAGLINGKGIVKVENDYLYFGASQIVTFVNKSYQEVLNLVASGTKFSNGRDKTIQVNSDPNLADPFAQATTDTIPRLERKLMSAGNELANISSVAIPSGLRFAVRNQAWNVAALSEGGTGYGRIKLFAILVPNNTIRGFVTVQLYAMAPNWLGIDRKINLVGYHFDGQVDLIIQPQFAHNLMTMTGGSDTDVSFVQGASEDHEAVFLCSKKLKEDATILGTAPGIPYSNQGCFTNCPNVLNDDYMNTGGQWWGNVFTTNDFTTLITRALRMNVVCIGKPPLPKNYAGVVFLTTGNE